MKELSIEEKAKAYDEAIERAKGAHNGAKSDKENDVIDKITEYTIQLTETIFPELKESEDERIRKWLIELVEEIRKANPTNAEHNGMCSEAKAWLEKQGEQKKKQYQIYESTKDRFYKEGVEDGILIGIKKQKPAWSEEDENNILFLTSIIEECFKDKEKITLYGDTVCANFTKEDVIDRLKSLRPHSQWKPSEYELKVLKLAAEKDGACLMGLYQQLKKLRGE